MTAVEALLSRTTPHISRALPRLRSIPHYWFASKSVEAPATWLTFGAASTILVLGIRSWEHTLTNGFLAYLALLTLGTIIEAWVPKVRRVANTFMLLAAIQLTLAEVLILIIFAYMAQFIRRPQDEPDRTVFAFTNLTVAVGIANSITRSSLLMPGAAVNAAIAAWCYFLVLTLSVIKLTFQENMWREWRCQIDFHSWISQAAVVGLLSEVIRGMGWSTLLAVVPAIFFLDYFATQSTTSPKLLVSVSEVPALRRPDNERLGRSLEES